MAVEYESFAYHNSPSEQGKDAIRSAALERQGIGVMHLNTIQLYDREACKDFAYNLAARLGKRDYCRKLLNENPLIKTKGHHTRFYYFVVCLTGNSPR